MRGGQLSYRRRRLLLVLSALCVLAGAIAVAVVLLPTGEKVDREPSPLAAAQAVADRVAARQAKARTPKHLSHAERERVISSISLFVTSSVERHHPERSWPVIHPLLREGLTKQQWRSGNIPVVPYPAIDVDLVRPTSVIGWTVLYEVVLEAAPKAHLARKTFMVELRRLPERPHRWAVSSWTPEGVSESQMGINAARNAPPALVAEAYHSHHLSGLWIVLPLGMLFGGMILLPTSLFVREAYRFRRAEAEFRATSKDSIEG